jgi:protocatechuate 3,4-dioxygenase beta subunit
MTWAYEPARNADPDDDSDGTAITMARPVPTPMFVADLDGANEPDGDEWRTTVGITVLDAHGQPVAGAKVYGAWSYGNTVDCTTDLNGGCSETSSWQDGVSVGAIGFTVTDITHPEPLVLAYDPAYNADPDGDSDGTAITMARPVPTPMFIADLDGVNSPNSSKWRTTIAFSVRDANQVPVAGAKVYGDWSYGSSANCTTDANGGCSLVSSEFEGEEMSAIGFTVTDITHPEPLLWAYDPAYNSDPDGDSDGTGITMARPVPTPMFIADLDGVNELDGDEWRTTVTITVTDANGLPVAAAKVFGDWSYGSTVNCTTDSNGGCSETSSWKKLAEVSQISLTVTDISHAEPLVLDYDPAYNADPDGDSDGTTIVLSQP